MSSSEAHLEDHFRTREAQDSAARLGMWIFLGTEILLFAGLFTLYAYYRFCFPDEFAKGSDETFVQFGTLNTFILVTSSFFVALAHHHAKKGRSRVAAALLASGALFGLGFLAVKIVEYAHEIRGGKVPGYDMFVTLYYSMTGLHAIHVTIGVGVLLWIAVRAARREFTREWHTPVELAGMYWHLVDVIWLFLYPLIYLIDRSRS